MGGIDAGLRTPGHHQTIRRGRRRIVNVTCHAYAKVNLALEVVGRRADGYHDIVSIFQSVDLHDVVRVALADESSLECNEPSLQHTENLVWRALTLLRE
ncbi:MAG: hypothetical protein ACYC4L_20565, partial [Chloroflexota bacterium]